LHPAVSHRKEVNKVSIYNVGQLLEDGLSQEEIDMLLRAEQMAAGNTPSAILILGKAVKTDEGEPFTLRDFLNLRTDRCISGPEVDAAT